MPLRSVKMKRFIFGFQRRVWCPKWTPLSSRFFMLTTATWRRLPSRARTAGAGSALLGCRLRTGRCAALVSGRATEPAGEGGTEVATAPLQQREEDTRSRPAGDGPHQRAYPPRGPAPTGSIHSPDAGPQPPAGGAAVAL